MSAILDYEPFVWPLLLIAVPILAAYIQRGDRRLALAWVNLVVGPALLGLVLLHAVVFNVPNNWAVRKEYGFLGYWFHLTRAWDFERHQRLYLGLGLAALIPAVFAAVVSPRLVQRARGEVRMAFAYGLQVIAALLLHLVPSYLLDMANHGVWPLDDWEHFQEGILPHLLVRIEIWMVPAVFALGLTLQTLRAETEAKGAERRR